MNKSIYTKRKVGNSSFFMSMAGLNVIGGGVGLNVIGGGVGVGSRDIVNVGSVGSRDIDSVGSVGLRDIDSVGVNSGSSVQLMGARTSGFGIGGNMFQVVSGKSCSACPSK